MTRREQNVARNTAVGAALVLGLISFCVSFLACTVVAVNTGLIPLHIFEPAPPMTWREQLAWCACVGVPSLASWVAMRQTFHFFRNLSLPR
jgi:hypothetical protein